MHRKHAQKHPSSQINFKRIQLFNNIDLINHLLTVSNSFSSFRQPSGRALTLLIIGFSLNLYMLLRFTIRHSPSKMRRVAFIILQKFRLVCMSVWPRTNSPKYTWIFTEFVYVTGIYNRAFTIENEACSIYSSLIGTYKIILLH